MPLLRLLCPVLLVLVLSATAAGDDPAPKITPLAEAARRVDQEVTVELRVASSRRLDSGQFCFLNSEKDFSSPDNFTIAIRGAALKKFAAAGIEKPEEHYRDKTIRVTGKVSLYRERPQILVDDPKQIVLAPIFQIDLPN